MTKRAHVLSKRLPVVALDTHPASKRAWDPEEHATKNFAALAGVSPAELPRAFALDTLLPYPEPSREALKDAGKLYRFSSKCWYLLVGTETVRALGKRALPLPDSKRLPWHRSGPGVLEWYESAEGIVMAVLPHPSGKNRWYLDARCKRAAQRFVREAVKRW